MKMSVIYLPAYPMYWALNTQYPVITDLIPVDTKSYVNFYMLLKTLGSG